MACTMSFTQTARAQARAATIFLHGLRNSDAGVSAINPRLRYYSSRTKSKGNNSSIYDGRPDRDASGKISTANLIPGSKRILNPPEQAIFEAAEQNMKDILKTYQKEISELETRATGRITPALLNPVKVDIGNGRMAKLDQLATVGVREGATLLISIFDEAMTKSIERAIYTAKIPHVIPQKIDPRTIKIPMPKPTVELKKECFAQANAHSEGIRGKIRREHKSVQAKHKFLRHSVEAQEFDKLEHKYVADVDALLKQMKKNLSL